MKCLTTLLFFVLFTLAGSAAAATLTGDWYVYESCVPGDDPLNPLVPKETEGPVSITQEGMFFEATGNCFGVIDGKMISMTCPPSDPTMGTGTFYHGELRGQNEIIGVNHMPDEGATCSSIVIR